MQPLELIGTARLLVRSGGAGGPGRAELRRAISTAYYAMFHALCQNCADCLIGGSGTGRSFAAWRQTYRAVEHGFAKNQYKNKNIMSQFPQAIEGFARHFIIFQRDRHIADYDPDPRFDVDRDDVEATIDLAEEAIERFQKVAVKHRRAFAAWTIMKNRTD